MYVDVYRRQIVTYSNAVLALIFVLYGSNLCRFVLRNYMAQEVIEKAETGDFTGVRSLLQLLKDPYGLGDVGASAGKSCCIHRHVGFSLELSEFFFTLFYLERLVFRLISNQNPV